MAEAQRKQEQCGMKLFLPKKKVYFPNSSMCMDVPCHIPTLIVTIFSQPVQYPNFQLTASITYLVQI